MKKTALRGTVRKRKTSSRELANLCVKMAEERKAFDITVMKVKDISSIADYFVICSGRAEKHVDAIGDFMEKELKDRDIICIRSEGIGSSRWVVKDYGDVIVHIFYHEIRQRYSLERLWGDAEFL